ncbi:cysteine desulfuration protein SufE [Flexibacter flexilis DSM 6793]|uniref:Cysteine desulfuration protein SufE n=1 Tax=Flexibacter flexilis DSM 6793 TaxID=927664 RepID=A0A1I1N0Z9_9BACT|nr:SufE family protein [Flexibacter flexilis]SFC91307.1 cysteine desulfuration protein SufE [Flexibacter flexilis DSM 6793]
MTINEIQNQIIEEFEVLGGDREMMVDYIMELGHKLAPLPEQYQTDDNLIKGCMSKVWLHSQFQDGNVVFLADSNTGVTKGLISLLVRVLSGQKPAQIANADLYFIEKIGMSNVIGTQRSNGLASMMKQMKLYAIAYAAQQQQAG